MLALNAGPSRRRDDLAWLRLKIAKSDLLILARVGEMLVLPPGDFPQRLPGFDRDLSVCFRRQIENHFRGIDVALDTRAPVGRSAVVHPIIEVAEALHLVYGVPGNALAAVAELIGKRTQRGEPAVGVWIVALDYRDLRRGDSGDEFTLSLLPVLDLERLREFRRSIVLNRREHHVAFDAEMADCQLREFACDGLVGLPV